MRPVRRLTSPRRRPSGLSRTRPALPSSRSGVDVVTYEFENVPLAAAAAAGEAAPVRPGAKALAVAQDRLEEKRFVASLGIPVAPFAAIERARRSGGCGRGDRRRRDPENEAPRLRRQRPGPHPRRQRAAGRVRGDRPGARRSRRLRRLRLRGLRPRGSLARGRDPLLRHSLEHAPRRHSRHLDGAVPAAARACRARLRDRRDDRDRPRLCRRARGRDVLHGRRRGRALCRQRARARASTTAATGPSTPVS